MGGSQGFIPGDRVVFVGTNTRGPVLTGKGTILRVYAADCEAVIDEGWSNHALSVSPEDRALVVNRPASRYSLYKAKLWP